MKKLFAFAISATLFIACGDDNSSSAPEETSSSSEETVLSSSAEQIASSSSAKEQDQESSSSTEVNSSDTKTESSSSATQEESSSSSEQNSSSSESTSLTIEITQPLSYVDTTNKRYYYLNNYCALDHENDKYVWVDGDSVKGIVDYKLEDYYSSQNRTGYTYLSYKISNNTLYKCISRDGSCDNPMDHYTDLYIHDISDSSSIFGTWTFIGQNDPLTGLKQNNNLKKTITISPEKIVTQEIYSQDPFDNAIEHCGTINMVVSAYDDYYKPCADEFGDPKKSAAKQDTVRFSDNYWVAKNGNGGVISFLNGLVFESRYTIAFDKKTNRKTWTKTAIYNGIECSYITSEIEYVSKETCESLDPADFGHDDRFETANYNEFKECIKQFDLSK